MAARFFFFPEMQQTSWVKDAEQTLGTEDAELQTQIFPQAYLVSKPSNSANHSAFA